MGGRLSLREPTGGRRELLANDFVELVSRPARRPAELARLVEARASRERRSTRRSPTSGTRLHGGGVPRAGAVADTAELDPVIEGIIEANPGQVEAYRGGKEGLLGFFVGQVMKETQGKADARVSASASARSSRPVALAWDLPSSRPK